MDLENRKRRRFILVWQTSDSLAEVVRRGGAADKGSASAKAAYFRGKHKVPLKCFRANGGVPADWDTLAKFAQELLDKEG